MHPTMQRFAICILLMFTSANAHAAAFDFMGLFFSQKMVITPQGFEQPEATIEPGERITFVNETTENIRIIIEDMKISSPPVGHGDSARVQFNRPGEFKVLCGKPCAKPLVVKVQRYRD